MKNRTFQGETMTNLEVALFAKLFYEIGSLRKVMRAHQQRLLTTDPTDTIAAHSFRTTTIGLMLAIQHEEDIEILKVVIMCLLHDLPETRTNDHHWVQKRYVKTYDMEVFIDQLGELSGSISLLEIMKEYEERVTTESIIAKDADLLDQMLLMREYELQGNKQATKWLHEDDGVSKTEKLMVTAVARKLAIEIKTQSPSEWTKGISTSKRR